MKKPGDGGEYERDGDNGDGEGVPQSDKEPVGHCINNGAGCIDPYTIQQYALKFHSLKRTTW